MPASASILPHRFVTSRAHPGAEAGPDILLLEKRVMFSASPIPDGLDLPGEDPTAAAEAAEASASADPPLDATLFNALATPQGTSLTSEGAYLSEAALESFAALQQELIGESSPTEETIPSTSTTGESSPETASTHNAPVLSADEIALTGVWEDDGPPTGAVGASIADIVNLQDAAGEIDRADYVPFHAAGSGDDALRNIWLWRNGWDDWAQNAQIILEKHGAMWIHLPYGRLIGEIMPGDARADAVAGIEGVHGPMPHIAEGLAHYLEQIVRPTDELYFYFGGPVQLYEEGMTYEEYEALALYEYEDALALTDNARVFVGLDATFAQPKSLGGAWTTVGGADGYNARLFQAITDAGATVILEPWIYNGETWAYDYTTISTERFYQGPLLTGGPAHDHWLDPTLKTGDHYRLLHQPSSVDAWHGGSWEQAIKNIHGDGHTPLAGLGADRQHDHSWQELSNELISIDSLSPLPAGGSTGAALPSLTTSTAQVANDNVADADSGAVTGIALLDVHDEHGTWWYSLNNGDTWQLLGDVSSDAARMLAADGATRLYFQPDPDTTGEISNAIRFRAWDQTDGAANGSVQSAAAGGGTTGLSNQIGTGWLYVTPWNDPPDITGATSQTVDAGDVLEVSSLRINDIDGNVGMIRVDVGVASGALTLSATTGLTFLVGDGVSDTNVAFTATLDDANAALATLRYVSWSTFAGLDGVSLAVNDLSNGGIGAPLSASALSVIEVIADPNALPRIGAPVYVRNLFQSGDFLFQTVPAGAFETGLLASGEPQLPATPSPPQLPDQSVENNLLAIRFGTEDTNHGDNSAEDPQPMEKLRLDKDVIDATSQEETIGAGDAVGVPPTSAVPPRMAVEEPTEQPALSDVKSPVEEDEEDATEDAAEDANSTSDQVDSPREESVETGTDG